MVPALFKVWLLCAVFVLAMGIIRGEGGIETYFALEKSRNRLMETVHKLKKETDDLEDEIRKIKTSKTYAKRVFKDKYHATDTSESIIFFAD